jgi:cell division protein FtsQ
VTERPPGGGLPPDLLGDDIPEAVLDELLVAFADRTGGPLTPIRQEEPAPTPPEGAATDGSPTPTSPAAAPTAPPGQSQPEVVQREVPAPAESVVVIEADDLPDAETLDGDPSVGLGTVIDTDATTSRPKVHPRFRARRIAVRRAASRRRLRWFVVAGGVALVVVAVLAVLASPLFDIDQVDVEGNVYADPAAVQAVVDELQGDPILTADLDGARARLEAIPWIQSARVTMHFPHRVKIEILERTPVASFRGTDGRFRVIDGGAFVVALLDNEPIDYPPITGILPNTPEGSDAGAGVNGAAQLIAALPAPLADRLTSVELGEGGNLTLDLAGAEDGAAPVVINFGAANDYREKLISVLNEMSRREPGSYSAIDVSQGDAVVE